MNSHKNAKLTARGREEMVRRMRHEPVATVAAGFGVSLRTARKWASRYKADGTASLEHFNFKMLYRAWHFKRQKAQPFIVHVQAEAA